MTDLMELGPIALAGPDEDCVPSTCALNRRSPFSRLGRFPAAFQGQPHGQRVAQRCQLVEQQHRHHSVAGSHSRPVRACVTESRVLAPPPRAAHQISQPAQTPTARAISNKQPSAESRLGGSSQPATPSRRRSRRDSARKLPFAAASLRGGGDSGRRRPSAAASLAGRGATLVLASVPHANYLFAEAQAPALASLLVLSDTVRQFLW